MTKDRKDMRHTILVVDDDKEVLISFRIWLDGEGFRPLAASNSAEAIEILEEEEVDVALLDFRLGMENGLKVGKMLKELDENLKVIIITGFPSYDTAVESIKSGMFDYLSKGAPNDKIMQTINKAIRARERELLEKGETAPHLLKRIIKLIVICKHSLIKERLESFSANYPDFKLMKTFSSLEELTAVEYVPEIDIAMMCATCCIESFDDAVFFFDGLYKLLPMVKPVIFNEHFSEKEKVELIRIGVKGFFSINMGGEELEKALSLIRKGETWASRKLISLAIPSGQDYLKNYLSSITEQSLELSGREKDILKALVLGLKNREIAEKLFISENTVKSHMNNIYKKFGVNNRAKAIRFAMDNKIL